jgi:hypothetical protein
VTIGPELNIYIDPSTIEKDEANDAEEAMMSS